jgi:hypothetical protein
MRPDLVVFVPDTAGDDLRFEHAAEQFAIKAFVSKTAVEASFTPFCHGLPWLD